MSKKILKLNMTDGTSIESTPFEFPELPDNIVTSINGSSGDITLTLQDLGGLSTEQADKTYVKKNGSADLGTIYASGTITSAVGVYDGPERCYSAINPPASSAPLYEYTAHITNEICVTIYPPCIEFSFVSSKDLSKGRSYSYTDCGFSRGDYFPCSGQFYSSGWRTAARFYISGNDSIAIDNGSWDDGCGGDSPTLYSGSLAVGYVYIDSKRQII